MKRCVPLLPACFAFMVALSVVSPAAAIEEADRLWLVGERAFADGLYPAARRALERLVAQHPKDPRLADAVLLLGKARLRMGDAQAALEAFKRAQALTPPPGQSQEARFWEAETLFRLKRFAEARPAYDDVVRSDAASPLAPDAVYGRAWSDLELKDAEAAISGFRDLLQTWPDHALIPSATLQLARMLADDKKWAEAIALLQPFPSKHATSRLVPDAQFLLGWVKTSSGDQRGGLADLRAFVARHPTHDQAATARRLVTQTISRSSDRDDMAEAYKVLMEQQPPSAEALHNAAQIAGRLGRPKDQEAAWKRLSGDFPDHPLTRRMAFDLAAAAFKEKDWKGAAALAQQATQADDAAVKAEAFLLVGESELKLKRFGPAAKAFEAVSTVGDGDAGVQFRALAGLGLAREEQREWKAALAAYEAVVARTPDATLRDWARERATAMKAHLKPAAKPPAKPAPAKPAPAKPAPRKDGKS